MYVVIVSVVDHEHIEQTRENNRSINLWPKSIDVLHPFIMHWFVFGAWNEFSNQWKEKKLILSSIARGFLTKNVAKIFECYQHLLLFSVFCFKINTSRATKQMLENIEFLKNLSLFIDSKLGFLSQFLSVVNKPKSILGFVKPLSKEVVDTYVIKTPYVGLIRPIPEYALTIWARNYNLGIDLLLLLFSESTTENSKVYLLSYVCTASSNAHFCVSDRTPPFYTGGNTRLYNQFSKVLKVLSPSHVLHKGICRLSSPPYPISITLSL